MRRTRTETMGEKIHRFRGVIFVVSVPLALIAVVVMLMPRAGPETMDSVHIADDPLDRKTVDRTVDQASDSATATGDGTSTIAVLADEETAAGGASERFAVIIDAGSTGSRVHVYRFNGKLELLEVNGDLELFIAKKPGLSQLAEDPVKSADSLRSLLDAAVEAVPAASRASTPVRVGATAGLRLLPGDSADLILAQVRLLLKVYPFNVTSEDPAVKILSGADEGSFAWVTVNYLLGNLGQGLGSTVAVVDLGGGSVQLSYAVSDTVAASAPKDYVRQLSGLGQSYNVYVHSYLGYGLMAARAAVLKLAGEKEGHPCIAAGFKETYEYARVSYPAMGRNKGASFKNCAKLAKDALDMKAECAFDKCSFGGVWSGGGGKGVEKIYVASYFFDRASQLGVLPSSDISPVEVKPQHFMDAASKVCSTSIANFETAYPELNKNDAGYACLDIVYQYTLLTSGFSIKADRTVSLVKQLSYKGKEVEAAWPLGAAIDAMS